MTFVVKIQTFVMPLMFVTKILTLEIIMTLSFVMKVLSFVIALTSGTKILTLMMILAFMMKMRTFAMMTVTDVFDNRLKGSTKVKV